MITFNFLRSDYNTGDIIGVVINAVLKNGEKYRNGYTIIGALVKYADINIDGTESDDTAQNPDSILMDWIQSGKISQSMSVRALKDFLKLYEESKKEQEEQEEPEHFVNVWDEEGNTGRK